MISIYVYLYIKNKLNKKQFLFPKDLNVYCLTKVKTERLAECQDPI